MIGTLCSRVIIVTAHLHSTSTSK